MLNELVYMNSKKLTDLHAETERLKARIRELEDRLVPPPSPPPSRHGQDSWVIEAQSRCIMDRESMMADLRRSGRMMERKITGLEDWLDNIRTVDEKLRARDARIRQLEEELTTAARTINAARLRSK